MHLKDHILKTAFLAFFVLISMSLAGASLAGDAVPEGVPTADFPQVNKGDIYIFQKGKFRLMSRILETSPDGSFFVEVANEATLDKKRMRLDRNFSNKDTVRSHNEYNYFLDFPLHVGKRWKDDVALITPAYSTLVSETYKYKVTSYVDVKVGGRTLKAYKIKFSILGGEGSGTIWYSPELNFVIKEDVNITQERNGISLKRRMGLVDYRGKYQDTVEAADAAPARTTAAATPSKTAPPAAPAKTEGPVAEAPKLNPGDAYTFKRGRRSYTSRIIEVHEDGSFVLEKVDEQTFEKHVMRLDRRFSTKNYTKWHYEYNYALDFPLFVGKRWEDKVSKHLQRYAYSLEETYKFKVSAYEDVKVGQKQVKAFKITFSLAPGNGKGTIWYSPEMKFVIKESIDISQLREAFTHKSRVSLVSYEPASGTETMLAGKPAPTPEPKAATEPATVIAKATENIKPAPPPVKPVRIDVIPRTGASKPDARAVVVCARKSCGPRRARTSPGKANSA